MPQDERRDDPRGRGWRRALAIAFAAVVVVALCLVVAEGGPDGTRVVAHLGGAGVSIAVLAAYLAAERRRRRTERDLGARPVAPIAAQGDGGAEKDGPPLPQNATKAELDGLLLHADDALAALRDLVAHGHGRAGSEILPELLERAGLMSWEGAPAVSATKLRRNGRWWLTPREGELSGEGRDRLLSIEASLNVNEDLERGGWPEGMAPERRVARALSRVADLRPAQGDKGPAMEFLSDGAVAGGEWASRLALSDRIENLPAPFRIEASFQCNVARRLVVTDVAVPRPACFAPFSDDGARRAALARAYALRLAVLVGRMALASLPAGSRAVVNCHEFGREETLLSLDLTHDALDLLAALARDERSAEGDLSDVPGLSVATSGSGWLSPVSPLLDLGDEEVFPRGRYREVELDDTPAPGPVARACGARRVSDLGIMEKAGRASAWNGVVHELGDTTATAVSRLVALREQTGDVTVAEACERAAKALVEGAMDVSDLHGLALLFVDGGPLADATRAARRAVDADAPTPEELSAALEQLEGALSPITEMGIYLDDNDSVYRYFNSVAERVRYNRTADDGGRRVRLVPDEYYAAHSLAARILGMLGRHDEALAHAEELMRVAPATPDAALCKVRCLEGQARIFEAADLLISAISYSATARDMSICFYRLAFMEWKLGRADLSVACYQRAIDLHGEIADQARQELGDLIAAEGPKLAPLNDEQVVPALEEGGLPAGSIGALRAELRDAVAACTDAGIFSVARPLTGALLELCRDDALVGVHRSLMRP